MLLTEDTSHGQFTIQRFRPGELVINHQLYIGSVILSSDQLIADWPPQHITELRAEHLSLLLPCSPELILFGTGSQQHFINSKMLATVINCHIGVEVMSTLAACRTYNLLIAESRRVVAALLIR